jgi:glutamyl-tRNA synthetase
LLGWSIDGETSLIDRNDLVENFDPSRINVSGAVFDSEKLDWMNGQYIKRMDLDRLGHILFGYWNDFPPEEFDHFPTLEESKSVAPLVQDRLKTLRDAAPLITFVFKDTIEYGLENLVQNGMDNSGTFRLLSSSEKTLSELEVFSAASIELALRGLADDLGVKVGQLLGTLRVATSGQKVSPPLFDSLEVLGRDKVLSLLENGKVIADSS